VSADGFARNFFSHKPDVDPDNVMLRPLGKFQRPAYGYIQAHAANLLRSGQVDSPRARGQQLGRMLDRLCRIRKKLGIGRLIAGAS